MCYPLRDARGPGTLNVAHVATTRPAWVCQHTGCSCLTTAMTRWPQVRKVAEDNGVDVSGQIQELEQRATQVRALFAALALRAFGRLLCSVERSQRSSCSVLAASGQHVSPAAACLRGDPGFTAGH